MKSFFTIFLILVVFGIILWQLLTRPDSMGRRYPLPIATLLAALILAFITILFTFITSNYVGLVRASPTPSPTHTPRVTFTAFFPIPSSSSTATPTGTTITPYYYEANLEGFGSYTIEDLEPGAMNFEYPVYLLPSSSEVVTLEITPYLYIGTGLPETFQRIPIPANQPLEIAEYFNYFSDILVAPQMRATLSSEGISVYPQFNNPKKNINPEGNTLWSWIIKTPAEI